MYNMRKYKRLIISMVISIIVSLVIIWVLKCNFREFNNKNDIINVFIGILGSSFVTMLGYMLELHFERKSNKQKLIQYYREISFKIIPYIKEMDTIRVSKIMEDDIIYKIRDLLANYKITKKILFFVNNKIEKSYDVDILDIRCISKYLKIMYILIKVHDYMTQVNTYIFQRQYLFNLYKSSYDFLKNHGGFSGKEIREQLKSLKIQYKTYNKELDQEVRNMILDKTWNNCLELDLSIGLINIKNDFYFSDKFK